MEAGLLVVVTAGLRLHDRTTGRAGIERASGYIVTQRYTPHCSTDVPRYVVWSSRLIHR